MTTVEYNGRKDGAEGGRKDGRKETSQSGGWFMHMEELRWSSVRTKYLLTAPQRVRQGSWADEFL